MRKYFALVVMFLLISSLAVESAEKIDVDFSQLNSMVAYSGLFDMMINPDAYLGKIIRIKGTFDTAHDEETGMDYFGVIIMDGSMCCVTGVDFVLKEKYKYPQDYPKVGAAITVTGKLERYGEGEEMYYPSSQCGYILSTASLADTGRH